MKIETNFHQSGGDLDAGRTAHLQGRLSAEIRHRETAKLFLVKIMNYKYCVKCGAKLPYIDADCDKCNPLSNSENTTQKLPSRISKLKIKNNIVEVAQKADVNNVYQLMKKTGFTPSKASRLFKGDWKNIDIATLTILCNSLQCTPNDILELVLEDECN